MRGTQDTATTQVTTAARRMRTALNARRQGQWRLYFDADGHETQAIYGPSAFGPRRSTYTHHFVTYQEPDGSMHRWTAREIQEAIDEAQSMAEYMKSQEHQDAVREMQDQGDAEYATSLAEIDSERAAL